MPTVTWKTLAYAADVIANTLLTTTGDTIYASANNTPNRRAIGNTGDVYTVASGIPTWAVPAAPAAHTLNSHTAANGAVDFGYQLANYLLVQTVTNEAALPATVATAKVGQLCWATGELTLHVCTVSTA